MHSPVCVGKRALNLQAVLCRAFAWLLAVQWREVALKGRRFINVYRSSQENLMDRTSADLACSDVLKHTLLCKKRNLKKTNKKNHGCTQTYLNIESRVVVIILFYIILLMNS